MWKYMIIVTYSANLRLVNGSKNGKENLFDYLNNDIAFD